MLNFCFFVVLLMQSYAFFLFPFLFSFIVLMMLFENRFSFICFILLGQ